MHDTAFHDPSFGIPSLSHRLRMECGTIKTCDQRRHSVGSAKVFYGKTTCAVCLVLAAWRQRPHAFGSCDVFICGGFLRCHVYVLQLLYVISVDCGVIRVLKATTHYLDGVRFRPFFHWPLHDLPDGTESFNLLAVTLFLLTSMHCAACCFLIVTVTPVCQRSPCCRAICVA